MVQYGIPKENLRKLTSKDDSGANFGGTAKVSYGLCSPFTEQSDDTIIKGNRRPRAVPST